jgi:hypothetical protein
VVFRLKLALAFVAAAALAEAGELSGAIQAPHVLVLTLIGTCTALALSFLGAGLLRRP